MIAGIGVDIVGIGRIKTAVRRSGEPFLRRIYTDREIAHCRFMKDPFPSFAGIFAAKEAVLKGYGLGWYSTDWKRIEIIHEASGRPALRLHECMEEERSRRGIMNMHITISHHGEYAAAFFVMETKTCREIEIS